MTGALEAQRKGEQHLDLCFHFGQVVDIGGTLLLSQRELGNICINGDPNMKHSHLKCRVYSKIKRCFGGCACHSSSSVRCSRVRGLE